MCLGGGTVAAWRERAEKCVLRWMIAGGMEEDGWDGNEGELAGSWWG